MYAFVQQQQQQQRRLQRQEEQHQHPPYQQPPPPQQASPFWHPQPAVPPTPTFHNNSALAAHSPMARYQASLHAEALHRHPWSAHPPATPAPSLPPRFIASHRLLQQWCVVYCFVLHTFAHSLSLSRLAHTQSPWRPPSLHFRPSPLKRAPDSLLQGNAPTFTRILVPVRPSIPPPAVAGNKTPLNRTR
jgi:hypothetical protein